MPVKKKPTKKKPAPKMPKAKRKTTKHKKPAFPRLCRLIEEAMRDTAAIADELLDLLPEFERLSREDREYIFAFMDVTANGFFGAVMRYRQPLPERPSMPDNDPSPIARLIGGIIGRAFSNWPPQPDPDWPDGLVIDPEPNDITAEYREIEPDQKLLPPPGEEGDHD